MNGLLNTKLDPSSLPLKIWYVISIEYKQIQKELAKVIQMALNRVESKRRVHVVVSKN